MDKHIFWYGKKSRNTKFKKYELLYTDTPDIVCINEALDLASEYSDDKVKSMINAVLDNVMKNKD